MSGAAHVQASEAPERAGRHGNPSLIPARDEPRFLCDAADGVHVSLILFRDYLEFLINLLEMRIPCEYLMYH